jgi:hypothetical protein
MTRKTLTDLSFHSSSATDSSVEESLAIVNTEREKEKGRMNDSERSRRNWSVTHLPWTARMRTFNADGA